MRLKKIKLAGFKSFVDPTSIPFPDEMTAIVGPNGCGKSNVIDAVRWVLGESSAKNLRGDAMTDVIFNGSTARKPVSQCSVELVFDNTSGRVQGEFANYAELSVKRLVTREAQSHYFLNATKCRRRDVTDIFLGTGLGPRSYAIIEQGMISRLIESKPQELRVFIEEAAGVSKYKERRRETENRIRHTKENLERLDDVRSELGLQLDKLQRQASAARKYKDLKAKERRLKSELSAIRWLKHSEKIQQLESEIEIQNNEIEEYIAKQRADEKDITIFKAQQEELKQSLTDSQDQFFKVGTEITKLEQNQLHAKQRQSQIEAEIQAVSQELNRAESALKEEHQQLQILQDKLALMEPEQEALAAQLEQSEERLIESQDALSVHENQWREQEQKYVQSKQQAQNYHSQIQANMNLQMRTQARIEELRSEQGELEHDVLAEQVESLSHQIAQSKGHFQHAKHRVDDLQSKLDTKSDILESYKLQKFDLSGKLQTLSASQTALQSIQNASDDSHELGEYLDGKNIEYQMLWQTLDVEAGWEYAVEIAIKRFHQAICTEQQPEINELLSNSSGVIFSSDLFTESKPQGTLATKLSNQSVPTLFHHILFAESTEQALARRDALSTGQSILTKQGKWFGEDWIDLGKNDDEQGNIQRASQIKQFEHDKDVTQSQIDEVSQNLSEIEDEISQIQDQMSTAKNELKQAEQALTQQQNQHNLLEMQHQQTFARETKISEELSKQIQLLEDETLQSETLNEQVAELELLLEEMAERVLELEEKRLQMNDAIQQNRSSVQRLTQESHQMDLSVQNVNNEIRSLEDRQGSRGDLLHRSRERMQQLIEEEKVLSQPMDEQSNLLENLLEQRLLIEENQQTIKQQLGEVESSLSTAEKGQQGKLEKIQFMRSQVESKKLECEGFKVRAKSTVEQLGEINQTLKTVLEELPADAEESGWQEDLEKTATAISRLGAVNLAAVEEFEVQAERKKHLDDQNEDLVAALETLEAAIRKIDKETRSRFKETYDRVNNDLKELFPKVFGGGSAYLELTGEDLLETGVTIMARPPGKKNSTIHLLSGGEKALTALSLVFAIFRLNPAPFCLLDEVDAPLDDANVGRFCKLVSEMSKTVQFIYITHNKIAMEMATHLTGVTMAEPGVSRMVAVDVEEAVAIAQA